MPKKDFNSFSSLLLDLWNETGVIVRVFLFVGMASGVLGFFWMMSSFTPEDPNDRSLRYAARLLILIGMVFVIVGGLVGLAVGVVLELILRSFRPPNKPRKRRRRP